MPLRGLKPCLKYQSDEFVGSAIWGLMSVKHTLPPDRGCNCHGVFRFFLCFCFIVNCMNHIVYELPFNRDRSKFVLTWQAIQIEQWMAFSSKKLNPIYCLWHTFQIVHGLCEEKKTGSECMSFGCLCSYAFNYLGFFFLGARHVADLRASDREQFIF